MRHNSGKYVAAMLVLSIFISQPLYAASIPSKTAEAQELASRDGDLFLARTLFATDRLANALAAEGLDAAQIEARIAALATPDLISLGRNPEQVRSAGISMSKRMWTAVGIGVGALAVGAFALKQNDDGEDEDGSDDGED